MMNKLITLFLFSLFLVTISIVSCYDCDGPYPNRYKVVDVSWAIEKAIYSDSDKIWASQDTLTSDTVAYDQLGFYMEFSIENYFSLNEEYHFDGIVTSAMACEPTIPTTDDFITKIDIFSDVAFDAEHEASQPLTDLFDAVVDYDNKGIHAQKQDLATFLATSPKAPNKLTLLLKSPPDNSKEITFTINYYQDGVQLDSASYTGRKLFVTN